MVIALIHGFQQISSLRHIFNKHVANLIPQCVAKGFAVEIGDDFHARFFHAVDDFFADLQQPVCADSYPLLVQMKLAPAGTPD